MMAPRLCFLIVAFVVMSASVPLAGQDAPSVTISDSPTGQPSVHELTPEEKMRARFPQPVKVGDLIGLPVLDGEDRTLGFVKDVVRTSQGKIELIVPYGSWFGWARRIGPFESIRRPIAVPIEVVAILARQIDAIDMDRPEFDKAASWSGDGSSIPRNETIRIALGRR